MDEESRQKRAARAFIRMVKHHYGGGNSPTFCKFRSLLFTGNHQNINALLSDIRSLFSDGIHLIDEFKRVFPDSNPKTTSKPKPKRKTPSPSQKQSLQDTLDFINKVKRTVDRSVFLKFVTEVMAYRKYNEAASVRAAQDRNLVKLLSGYPALEAELNAIHEDDMHLADLSFHRMLSVRDAAEKLKRENVLGRLEEEINVTDYFSPLDFICTRDQCSTVLSRDHMSRGKAIKDSMTILTQLSNKIEEVGSMRWTDEEMHKVQKDHQKEIEIPEWDWHCRLSEDKFSHLPPIEFWSRPKKM